MISLTKFDIVWSAQFWELGATISPLKTCCNSIRWCFGLIWILVPRICLKLPQKWHP